MPFYDNTRILIVLVLIYYISKCIDLARVVSGFMVLEVVATVSIIKYLVHLPIRLP